VLLDLLSDFTRGWLLSGRESGEQQDCRKAEDAFHR
jgi:hypothetical protein